MAILPQVFLGPFAGVFVDRWDKRRVLILADLSVAALVLILAFLYTYGIVQIWHIYIIMFLRSLGGAFQWPAMQTTTALMVPKKHLSRVSGFNQALQGMANILAPPMGALLLEFLPVERVLYIDVATAALAVAPLLVTSIPNPKVEEHQILGVRSVIMNLKEGMLFIWNWKGLRLIMGISMAINLLMNPAFSLLPLLVTKHFGRGAIELAWIQSAGGLGMIFGGLALGVWGGFKKRIITAMIALILSGVFVTVLGLTPPGLIILAVISMFLFNFTNAIANSIFMAALQAIVPPKIQGRVWTLLGSLSMAMSPVGLAIAGPIADTFGERIWFNIGGLMFIILGVASFMSPTIMNVEEEGANHRLPNG
jgi:DHA3 family macrolide efflux protein-like MFS transporter